MRETGPMLVKGDPARKGEGQQIAHHHHYTPTISATDSSLKFTHYLHNLSPAGIINQTFLEISPCLIISTLSCMLLGRIYQTVYMNRVPVA
jgi:phosphoenolpyruvate carboxykinase (ATP)